MRNSWMLATANLRKSKGNAISLTLVMVLVAMFINIGFAMLFGIGDFFDSRAEELNTRHIVTHLSDDYAFANSQLQFVQSDYRVEKIEIQNFVTGDGYVLLNDMPDFGLLTFSPIYENQQLNPLTLVGEYLPLDSNAIYVPHFMVLFDDLELGDTMSFNFMETELEFTFAGSIDDIMFGSINAWRRRIYVSEDMFADLERQFPQEMTTTMMVRLYDANYTGAFVSDYLDYLLTLQHTADSQEIISRTHDFVNARNNHTMIPTIIGSILAVFAIVFLVVSLVVIRFRINNSIDEGMTNIGILKSLGYSNRQIITSTLMQFGLIATVGGTIGLLLGQSTLPFVVGIMGPMFSLQWQPDVNILAKVAMLGLIVTSVIVFSLLSTKRIYKLYPLVALRGGTSARNSKRSAFPLDKVSGPIALLFAIKDIMQNKRQAISVGIIILAITFTAVAGLSVNYVVNVNNEEFLRVMVGEPFDLAVVTINPEYADAFEESMLGNPQVENITGSLWGMRYTFEDTIVSANVVADHSKLYGQTLVTGHFPIYYNEIAISRTVMNETGKNIGDWATIHSGGQEFQFLITGMTQSMDGMTIEITGEGVRRMHDFEFQSFAVFLQDGVCSITFVETMRETEDDIFMQIMVFDEIAEGFIESMGGIFSGVAVLIMVVVAVIVVATMYLVIKTAVLRKRRELGVQKALGFTTLQLMNQVALNLTPAIIFGSVVGAIVAFNTFDLFFVMVTGAAGHISVSIPISIGMTVAAAVGIIALAYVVSMAVAWRIRKISAYALVSE